MTTTDDALSIEQHGWDKGTVIRWGLRTVLVAGGLAGAAWLITHSGASIHLHAPRWNLMAAQPFAIKFHVVTVLLAFLIGCVLMVGVKGSTMHRVLGWAWVILMVTTGVASFFIHTINPGGFSPVHALSAWVVVASPFGLFLARRHKVVQHRRLMTGLFLFGLIVAGGFTFLPGRLMFEMFFG